MSAAPKLPPIEHRFKPGQSGNPGGRTKRAFKRVDEILKELGKEPIGELMKLIPELRPREQAQVWLEILPYVHAKLKPLEHEEDNELENLSTAELLQLVKDNLPEELK